MLRFFALRLKNEAQIHPPKAYNFKTNQKSETQAKRIIDRQ